MASNITTTVEDDCATAIDLMEDECSASVSEKLVITSEKICSFYVEGKCRFGDNCFNLHEGEVIKDIEKMKKSPKKKLEEVENEPGKKPPLRTAGDVRKRIQWDSALPSGHFRIGYIDRFSGVEEQPFSSFSWEHLADAEEEDLAIPQHRIQYYKYRGIKVWDKTERLDHVFGSAGNEKTIEDAMKEIDEELSKREADLDSDSDEENIVVNDGTSVPAPQIQKEDERLRATHFLCIRVDSDGEVAAGIKQVQNSIEEGDSDLSSCLMPKELLHITLSMIKCESNEAIQKVKQLLTEFEEEVKSYPEYNQSGNIIQAQGLSTFGARVLFSKLQVPPLFMKMVQLLQDKFADEEEIVVTNHFEYVPHLTILKVNRVIARDRRSKYINSCLYNNHLDQQFGSIDFNNIHFCVINDYRGLDQFYLTHSHIKF